MGPPFHVHRRQTEIFRFLEGEYKVAVLRVTLAPALEGEAFFRDLAGLASAGKLDPAALEALAARFGTEFVGPPLGG